MGLMLDFPRSAPVTAGIPGTCKTARCFRKVEKKKTISGTKELI